MARRNYGGRTGNERVALRRAALLDAALELAGGEGWAALSIEATCRRAGLNKRYFYESFAGLDAAMAALIDDVSCAVLDAALDAMPADGTPEELTAAGVRAMVEYVTDDPRRARVLFDAPPPGGAAAARRAAATRQAVAVVAARGRTAFPHVEAEAFALPASMVVGGTSQAVLDWLDGAVTCTRDELIDNLVGLWLAIEQQVGGAPPA